MIEKRFLLEIEYITSDDVVIIEKYDGIKHSDMKEIVKNYMEKFIVKRVKWDFLGY